MPNSFQQQSLNRKLVYLAVMLVLFGLTLALRTAKKYGIETQAEQLALREHNQGEVDLTSSAVRWVMTGSRGMVVCFLWMTAIENQTKHEWNKLELMVRSLTKLQPHFITPWMFQSWNLAYNVSVESDRVKDKYFYVTRGIQLLGEGERRNSNHPDMRLHLGIYTQNKISRADEGNTLRCLFQMSCIDPIQRNPDRLRPLDPRTRRPVVNLAEFEDFCRNNPQLVRRLRTTLRCRTPDDVIDFLKDNQNIPSRFDDRTDLKEAPVSPPTKLKDDVLKRFPVLPGPSRYFDPSEITYDTDLDYTFDNFDASRAWFGYAQDPLPGRKPRYLTTVIFQGYPARAQAYLAEKWELEGWFDEAWEITDWFPEKLSDPDGKKKTVAVGGGKNWAEDAWESAFQKYRKYGEDTRQYLPAEEFDALSDSDKLMYQRNRGMTNFPHFYHVADVERTKAAITARKYFDKAERLRRTGNDRLAVAAYENPAAFGKPETWWDKSKVTGWKRIFLDNPDFARDVIIQEETYSTQLKYLYLLQDRFGSRLRRVMVADSFLTQAANRPPLGTIWLPPPQLVTILPVPILGPFDDLDNQSLPLITDEAIYSAQSRLALNDPTRSLVKPTFSRLPASLQGQPPSGNPGR